MSASDLQRKLRQAHKPRRRQLRLGSIGFIIVVIIAVHFGLRVLAASNDAWQTELQDYFGIGHAVATPAPPGAGYITLQ